MFKQLASLFSKSSVVKTLVSAQSAVVKTKPLTNRWDLHNSGHSNSLIEHILFPFLSSSKLQRVPVYVRSNVHQRRLLDFNKSQRRHYSLLLNPSVTNTLFRYQKSSPKTFNSGFNFNLEDGIRKLFNFTFNIPNPSPYLNIIFNTFLTNFKNKVSSCYTVVRKFYQVSNNGNTHSNNNSNISASSAYADSIHNLINNHKTPPVSFNEQASSNSSIEDKLGCKLEFRNYPNSGNHGSGSYLLNRAAVSKISSNIDHQIKELTLLKEQLFKIHSSLGMLPISFENENNSIQVHFPNSTMKEVELLSLDLGITRGSVVVSGDEVASVTNNGNAVVNTSDTDSWCSCISEREFFVDVPVVVAGDSVSQR